MSSPDAYNKSMQNLSLIQSIAVYAIPALLAITVHEAAHGYAARHFGDRTAEMLGRLTLNPLKHIDPVGTILVPLTLLVMAKLSGGQLFLFGWAKPVPVSIRNLRNPRRAPVPLCLMPMVIHRTLTSLLMTSTPRL